MTEETIFAEALEKSTPIARTAYLDQACAGDTVLRRRIETLLKSHGADGNFLGKPAIQCAAEELVGQACVADTQGETPADNEGDEALDILTSRDKPGALGRLGHYEILEVIGRGGMGIVLRAVDEKLQRVVAIKVMAARLATNGTARKRFTREAQAAAAVTHDHLVTIHAVEEANGQPYLVMQYVSGMSLQERLDRSGPLELKEIVRIGMQTASGLAAAHSHGLIHRDIKPANILLENGVERVKITDFGLARAVADASLTQCGVVAGTPQYMSPEQARGEAVDQRADLFSLGSVLYAMCTGRAPFRAESGMVVLKRVCDDHPSAIRATNPEVPEWLVAIVTKLHAKNPADRFQSAAEVAELLKDHLAHLQHPSIASLPVTRPVQRPTNRRRRMVAAMVLLGLALSSVGLGLFLQRKEDDSSQDKSGTDLAVTKPNVLVQDALLWMNFEKDTFYSKGDATYVRDLSGHGRDGLCEKCEFTSEGQAGGALRLKGGGLKVPHRLLNKQSEYTVTTWIFFDDLPAHGFPVMEEFWQDKIGNFTLAWFPTHVFVNTWNSKHSLHWKASNAHLGVTAGQWNFVAVRLKDGGLDQGDLLVTCNDKTVKVPSQMEDAPLEGYTSFGRAVEGMLDELLVLPRALSDDEVRLLYELGQKGQHPVPTPAAKSPPAAVAAKPDARPFVILGGKEVAEGNLDPDRKAAEYVLSIGGTVYVNDEYSGRKASADLPPEPFRLTSVLLTLNKQVSDAGLAVCKDCKNLTYLHLGGTPVTNAGLAHFKDCKNLTALWLHHTQVSDAGLVHFTQCSKLTSLHLACTQVSDAGLAHFKDCKDLRHLDLESTKVSDAGLAYFKDCNLTHVVLHNTQVGDAGMAHLKNCKNLEVLNLSSTQVSDGGLAAFQDCKVLTYLHLSGTPVGNAGLAHFKDCKDLIALGLNHTQVSDAGLVLFKECSNLTFLHLSRTQVSDAGLANFKGCKKLEQLDLEDTKVSDAGLAYFKDCNLTHLVLRQTQVGDAGMAHLKDCKNLILLNLSGTQVSDGGLAYFQDCRNVTHLHLGGTPMSNAGLAHFKDCKDLIVLALDNTQVSDGGLEYFKDCTKLTELTLSETEVSDAGIKHLAGLKNLGSLDLRRTMATAAGVAELQKALPKCKIEWVAKVPVTHHPALWQSSANIIPSYPAHQHAPALTPLPDRPGLDRS